MDGYISLCEAPRLEVSRAVDKLVEGAVLLLLLLLLLLVRLELARVLALVTTQLTILETKTEKIQCYKYVECNGRGESSTY